MADTLRIKRRALGGAAGAPGSLAVGELAFNEQDGGLYIGRSNGSVVQVNGAAPGFLVQIARQDVSSAVATVDFTSGIDNTYDEYEIHFYGVQLSTTLALVLRISQDGGATWKAGATDYNFAFKYTGSGASAEGISTGAAFAQIGTVNAPNALFGMDGTIKFARTGGGRRAFRHEVVGVASGTGHWFSSGMGVYVTDTNPFNGIRFLGHAAGNITAGTFILYGVKK